MVATEEYTGRNNARRKQQKVRRAQKEEKKKQEEERKKKREAKKGQKSVSKKRKVRDKRNDDTLEKVAKRVKRSLNIQSPKISKHHFVVVKANTGGGVNLASVPPNIKRNSSVQMNTFI